MKSEYPNPKIKRRQINVKREEESKRLGLSPMLAKIIASRPFLDYVDPKELLWPKLKSLDSPLSLADIKPAVARLVKALENDEIIGIETDHDCDGQTSHAVIYVALTEYFGHKTEHVRSYIGHRLKEGYGLSDALAKRILSDNPRPTLIITADNGSSDEDRIAMLKKEGIDVIVTDHHEIPISGIPQSAYAVVNPTREDCQYPDTYIAGCMVAWLLMAATRTALIERKGIAIASLAACLDFVAVGTIADCVSIARSRNNRAVVSYGMKLIQQGLRPCWKAILPLVSNPLTSEDIGFKIGPLLNSDGRLSCAFGSVSFLLAADEIEAKHWIEHLQTQNAERKGIQERVTHQGLKQAKQQYREGRIGLCLFLEEGHAGVHGISASRIKDIFGRPVIIFCPKADDPSQLTGSARSVDGVHLRNILQTIDDTYPGVIKRFGGHQGAAGLTIDRENLALFQTAFEQTLQENVAPELIGPVIWTDGEIDIEYLNLSFIDELANQLEPFGREFEPPHFEMNAKILSVNIMGQTKVHARLGLAVEDLWFEAVWFNCKNENTPLHVGIGDLVKVVFAPKPQVFRGEKKLSCQIVHLEVV